MQIDHTSLRPITRGPADIPAVSLQAGLLTHRSIVEAAFPISQWRFGSSFPVYSDEFAQDLHLFPFSSASGCPTRGARWSTPAEYVFFHFLENRNFQI